MASEPDGEGDDVDSFKPSHVAVRVVEADMDALRRDHIRREADAQAQSASFAIRRSNTVEPRAQEQIVAKCQFCSKGEAFEIIARVHRVTGDGPSEVVCLE